MKKYTKIVATVSDKRCDVDFVKALAEAGVNVVRMNSAHLEYEGFSRIVENVRRADKSLGIMMDTKGPEIRTTVTETGEPIQFHTCDEVLFFGEPDGKTSQHRICLNYPHIAEDVKVGDRFLIDDGELEFDILSIDGKAIKTRAANDGLLGSRKSVNVPGVSIALPAVTERDRRNIGYAVKLGVDFIAHSFVRSAADVQEVRDILRSYGSEIQIISKIENQEGVDNFDEILAASYGIMIARGDLGIEVPAERIPGIQLMMINKCIAAHKPVIVATQMLHSMIEHPRPTRAEVSDVAGAVYQRADAIMLSGETAYGKYPVEAVKVMSSVAHEVEKSLASNPEVPPMMDARVTSFLSRQAVISETAVGTKAILTDTYHGLTARFIASFRGKNPTIAICYNRRVQRWLALSYGVMPYCHPCDEDMTSVRPIEAIRHLIDRGSLSPEDRVAYLSGNDHGATSLEINTIANLIKEE